MDADLRELKRRVTEAEERVKRTTHLMLRAVWQYVTQHRSSFPSSSGKGPLVGTGAGKLRHAGDVVPPPKKRGGAAAVARGGGRRRGVDQARVSRELYRKVFGAARQEAEEEAVLPGTSDEGDGIPSVALLLLQSARERAIMLVFVLRLRFAAHRRRVLNDECVLRYSYYRLRRTLQAWRCHTREVNCRRQMLLLSVLDHWVRIVVRRRHRARCLHQFCLGLRNRRNAFEAVRRHKLRRCFLWWRRRLDVCRTVGGMEERATEMRRRHKYIELTPIVQRSGGFAVKERVFSHWKRKTEHRLDSKLADLISRRSLMRLVWEELVRRYASARPRRTLLCPAADYDPPAVFVEPQSTEFILLKSHCAQQVARGSLKKTAFLKWHAKYLNKLSDMFFVFHCRLRVMETWLQAVQRRRVTRFVVGACWWRWRQRLHLRLHTIEAHYWRRRRLQALVLRIWRHKTVSGSHHRRQTLQSCWCKWRQRAKIHNVRRRLAVGCKRRALLAWRGVAARETEHRTMLCVAETLREFVLLVGCFRRWKGRHQHACRVRISESILSDLRRERQRARLFQRWKRLTFCARDVDQRPLPLTWS